MDFLTKLNLAPAKVLKLAGILLVGVIAIAFVFSLAGVSVRSVLNRGIVGLSTPGTAPAYDSAQKYGYGEEGVGGVGLSTRNIAPVPQPPGSTGPDAEEYEVTEYQASIDSARPKETCTTIADLKSRAYVIFESATDHERGCTYTFKVAKDSVPEILALLKDLDPEELSESTYTIQRLVDDFTSELDILERKQESIDETLENAISAYDEITILATRAQDVESLAKIIDSKLNLIQRLTQERINIAAQIERLQRAKADQLDRLDYTYFYVTVSEDKYIDGEGLKESWQRAVKVFIQNVNDAAQGATIGLVGFLIVLLQYALYALILLFVAKYGWRLVKYIWQR